MTRPRVALVVTGRLEFRALPSALGRLFPGAEFFIERSLLEAELKGGVAALRGLDWGALLAEPGAAPFLRALAEDLSEGLGQPPALRVMPFGMASAAPTALSAAPRARVLRNV